MKLVSVRPMLYTDKVKETIAFYVNNLGFTCNVFDEVTQWAAVSRDHIQFMITKPNDHTVFVKPQFSGSFYINLDDGIDALWTELKDKSIICYPIETFDYGMREFAIYDNNGYLLQFGQEV